MLGALSLFHNPPQMEEPVGSGDSVTFYLPVWASQVVRVVKNLPASAGDVRDTGSIPGLERFPWRRAWQPTPGFSPGESHGQRSLAGYLQSIGSCRVRH